MNMNVHAISTSVSIPVCISMEDIQVATQWDTNLQMLKSYIIQGWLDRKDEVEQSINIIGQSGMIQQCSMTLP